MIESVSGGERVPIDHSNTSRADTIELHKTGHHLMLMMKAHGDMRRMWRELSLRENLEVEATFMFMYMKHYGWAPGDTSFLWTNTNVILSLRILGCITAFTLTCSRMNPNLGPSVLASVTYLADLASLDNKISIWRSALPQHFDTPDGHYNSNSSWDGHVCTTLKSARNYSQYNRIYKDKFSELKPINESSRTGV